MVKKMLLLIMLSFSLAVGGFWVLRAQDPKPQKPDNPAMPAQTPAETPMQKPAMTTQQVDLSGTYAGTFNCEEAGLVGDTTLTITGNEFTTGDGRKGRIIASKSSGYTAVALQVSPADASGTATAKVISLRGKKSGNKLTLSPVSGSTMKCSFTTSKMAKTPAATGTDVANPAAMPAQTPSPSPSPTPSPEPMPSPTPSGSPRPTPIPTPTPSPTPGEPTPTPTATPSPSPSPSPRIA